MGTLRLEYLVEYYDVADDTEGYEPFWSYQLLNSSTPERQ